MLRFLVNAALHYEWRAGARHIKGLPVRLARAPQLATLPCYPIEKKYVLETKPTGLVIRFIDDFWV